MKNCSLEAKNIVSILDRAYMDFNSTTKPSSHTTGFTQESRLSQMSIQFGNTEIDVRGVVFRLKNYLSVDIFAEEFISYEGIKRLVDIILVTSANTRVIMFIKNM